MTGRRLELDDVTRIAAFAAEAPRPLAVLEAVGALARDVLGARGFTMFRYLHASAEVERIHSSDPVQYPLGGRKRIVDYPRNQAVLARGDVFIAPDREAVRATYKDHEKIFGLGTTSIMNVPVRFAGTNIGALNLFGTEHQFDAAKVHDARVLAALMVAPILAMLEADGAPR